VNITRMKIGINGVLMMMFISLGTCIVPQTVKDLVKESQLITLSSFGTALERDSIRSHWRHFADELSSFPSQVQLFVKEIGPNVKNMILEEFLHDAADTQRRIQKVKSSLQVKLEAAAEKVVQFKNSAKKHLDDFEANVVKQKSPKAWQDIKTLVNQAVTDVEQSVNKDLASIKGKWTKFFEKVEQHQLNHKPHHPTLQCGTCGKVYTLHEFLDLFRDKDYLVQVEDWWTDSELEEFYSGWSVWANRSAVHCKKCTSCNWKEIRFVSDEEEKKLEQEEFKHDEL